MQKVWIFDIDGTLSDMTHRVHHITGGNSNWDEFFDNQHLDRPYEDVFDILHAISLDRIMDKIIFVTARPERYRGVTNKWLQENIEYFIEDEDLYMKPNDNTDTDAVFKVNLINQWLTDNPTFKVGAIFDDRPTVIKAFREQGWHVFDCNQSGEEF